MSGEVARSPTRSTRGMVGRPCPWDGEPEVTCTMSVFKRGPCLRSQMLDKMALPLAGRGLDTGALGPSPTPGL